MTLGAMAKHIFAFVVAVVTLLLATEESGAVPTGPWRRRPATHEQSTAAVVEGASLTSSHSNYYVDRLMAQIVNHIEMREIEAEELTRRLAVDNRAAKRERVTASVGRNGQLPVEAYANKNVAKRQRVTASGGMNGQLLVEAYANANSAHTATRGQSDQGRSHAPTIRQTPTPPLQVAKGIPAVRTIRQEHRPVGTSQVPEAPPPHASSFDIQDSFLPPVEIIPYHALLVGQHAIHDHRPGSAYAEARHLALQLPTIEQNRERLVNIIRDPSGTTLTAVDANRLLMFLSKAPSGMMLPAIALKAQFRDRILSSTVQLFQDQSVLAERLFAMFQAFDEELAKPVPDDNFMRNLCASPLIDEHDFVTGDTVLIRAVKRNRLDVAKRLTLCGSNVNVPDSYGNTALNILQRAESRLKSELQAIAPPPVSATKRPTIHQPLELEDAFATTPSVHTHFAGQMAGSAKRDLDFDEEWNTALQKMADEYRSDDDDDFSWDRGN